MLRGLKLNDVIGKVLLMIGKQAIKRKVKAYVNNSNSERGWNNQAVVGSEGNSLEFLFLWACEKVSGWVKRVGGVAHPLQLYFFRCFLGERTKQVYEIIWDYPDSIPCLPHFKACLDLTGDYTELR